MKQPKFRKSILAATAAACGCAAIWSLPTMAAQDPTTTALQQQIQKLNQEIDQLQSQSQQLGQQVQQLEKKQKSAATATTTVASTAPSKPESKNKTYLGGAFYLNYGRYSNSYNGAQPGPGDGGFSYMSLNANGNYGNLTWGFDERIGPSGQIADKELMHLAWVGYDFDKSNSMTAGFFQVPFGNYPYGYDVYWGSMGYYLGFNDNQALGAGYTFKRGAWRWDLDAFKNYDAGQNSLYAGNPFQEYRMVDTGNTRLSYTFGKGTSNTVDVSGSFRGGHLEVGGQPSHYGTHWAGAVAADAELGPWSLRGQVVMYKYNVPAGRFQGPKKDGQAISRNSILMEDYGFESA
ncbi:MAG TPA: hypothetical protein VFQ88_13380, partial [Nevskiaceae bacterium]|nr:hypothetical protein [Nevskiaceae bacterium]